MSKIEFLKEQMIEARAFVKRLMSELPEDLWYVIPRVRIQISSGRWDIYWFRRIFIL